MEELPYRAPTQGQEVADCLTGRIKFNQLNVFRGAMQWHCETMHKLVAAAQVSSDVDLVGEITDVHFNHIFGSSATMNELIDFVLQ